MHSPSAASRLARALTLAAVALLAALGAASLRAATAPRASQPTRVAIVSLAKVQAGLLESKDIDARAKQLRDDSNRKLEEVRQHLDAVEKDLKLVDEKKEPAQYRQLLNQRREW